MNIRGKNGKYGIVTMDFAEVDRLNEFMYRYRDAAASIITAYLAAHGLDTIGPAITRLLPVSGRRWARKLTAASSIGYDRAFRAQRDFCAVTVRTVPVYGYLYFPDDGGDTQRHRGNQRFMLRGAEAAAPQLIDGICSRLISKFEEG